MTFLLAIETSSESCSVALSMDGEVREVHEHAPLHHAEILLPAVNRLLAEAGISLSALDVIAFGRGPGSFTSLRIGIGVVQGLAWGAEVPVIPVSSLAAVALEASELSGGDQTLVRVALDARMQQVYHCDFRAQGPDSVVALSPERVCNPGELSDTPDEPFIVAGNGFERFEELEQQAGNAVHSFPQLLPRASMIVRLALNWLRDNEPLPAALAQPVYIRNEVAVKPSRD
jgi:tRNA threonylcarbamoyladenosine biosynthesis protein TsaB